VFFPTASEVSLNFLFFFICSAGGQDVLERLFPGMQTKAADGYQVAIQFDCDNLPDPQKFLNNVSDLRRVLVGGGLDRAFNALLSKTSDNLPVATIELRNGEPMFIVPSEAKIIVIFAIDFGDATDKALARVFMQEFVEAQRVVRNAPPVSFSKEPPPILTSRVNYNYRPDMAGFISFAVEERHVAGPGKEKAIGLLTGFRNYLHYHIKCSKTYLHMRMRKKVAGWMLVLNRAMPEVETEKKTAAGKTFVRK
jgi:actin related protein 2/3 complex subunit 2